ncbi:hypothetical protein HMPREF1084_01733 [Clostridium butyricum 60E.3]|uniref:Uncharacterized protein n=1 Tax=Clostridium butyricum TaxID=1492 RepID=A0A6N3G004_CLOBU|nr:hypothetical protein [Clostridium butyricum]ENZ33265.1 hypothetical protein HMPREF1084_01733 [Clostridium butyricum 60E.3]
MKSVNALKVAKEHGLYLKLVTAVRNFDSYNSFYNIYDEFEEPCRRIAIITKNEIIEEVYDNENNKDFFESKIIEGNLWIEEYSLLTNPEKIDLSQLEVPETLIKNFLDEI